MPPRVPFILVFFACYFAVIAGGGVEALAREVSAPLPGFMADAAAAPMVRLSVAELLAALAALCAAPDAALRPARTLWDRMLTSVVALGAIAVAILAPSAATLGFGVLTALALGDAAAALALRRRRGAAPAA